MLIHILTNKISEVECTQGLSVSVVDIVPRTLRRPATDQKPKHSYKSTTNLSDMPENNLISSTHSHVTTVPVLRTEIRLIFLLQNTCSVVRH